MATAKDIIVKPIASKDAIEFIKAHHYSGKVTQNSQLHLGVFLDGRLHGAMQFGPSLDKRKIQGLVSGTKWHEFLELNRLAFDDVLPRNSESRALSVAFRMIRKNAPQVKWIISFADGTQCGDGTIYRAAGFVLTAIKENDQIWAAPDGEVASRLVLTNLNPGSGRDKYIEKYATGTRVYSRTSLTDNRSKKQQSEAQAIAREARVSRFTVSKGKHTFLNDKIVHAVATRTGRHALDVLGSNNGAASMRVYVQAGFKPLEGFQLRYIYFIDPSYRARLTVPELPYSEIERRGARMYKGQKLRGEGEIDSAAQSNVQTEGASPISPLLTHETLT